jgi:hypothetical protein
LLCEGGVSGIVDLLKPVRINAVGLDDKVDDTPDGIRTVSVGCSRPSTTEAIDIGNDDLDETAGS